MPSTMGETLTVSVFGQSHSEAIGCVISGLPSGIKIDMDVVRSYCKQKDVLLPALIQGFKKMNLSITAEGIETETPDANTVIVKGINKALVGNYAANIRAWRKPEPYKGKGIRYENEHIRRKEGKTGAGA